MMPRVTCRIVIGNYFFDYMVDVTITSSIDNLTNNCIITIPRKLGWNGKTIAIGDDPILKRKDFVRIDLGYNGNFKTRFLGFIKEVKAGMPVRIDCMDYMFLLKTQPITGAFKAGTSLQTLLDFAIPPSIKKKVADVNVGAWRINKASPAQVLDELRSKLGLFSYFRLITENNDTQPVLYSGLAYWTEGQKEHLFAFENNIIEHDLTYKRLEDIELKVTAIGIQRDNSRIEIVVGDLAGEQRTVFKYLATKEELTAFANRELERLKYTGYRGTFTTFGEPAVEKGDIANITGNKYHPDGKYLIRSVTVRANVQGGYKQIIELDSIVNPSQQ